MSAVKHGKYFNRPLKTSLCHTVCSHTVETETLFIYLILSIHTSHQLYSFSFVLKTVIMNSHSRIKTLLAWSSLVFKCSGWFMIKNQRAFLWEYLFTILFVLTYYVLPESTVFSEMQCAAGLVDGVLIEGFVPKNVRNVMYAAQRRAWTTDHT